MKPLTPPPTNRSVSSEGSRSLHRSLLGAGRRRAAGAVVAGLAVSCLSVSAVVALSATPGGGADAAPARASSRAAALTPVASARSVSGFAPRRMARHTVVTPARVRELRVAGPELPERAAHAYQRAQAVLGEADPRCHLPWELLAAIGQVESDHGRFAGAVLSADGVARPRIVGPRLDGHGAVARIRDTDAGQLDGDPSFDRAVGPMQFLPGTWSVAGVDGDGDGRRDPQDLDDAALAAGVYLCNAGGDLRSARDVRSALLRYNASAAYARLVRSLQARYAGSTLTLLPDQVAAVPVFQPLRPAHPAAQAHPVRHTATVAAPSPVATGTPSPHPTPSGSETPTPGHGHAADPVGAVLAPVAEELPAGCLSAQGPDVAACVNGLLAGLGLHP